jgi:acyl-CoA reductase-like NAD-dependent aldehyde dehydrogenase
MTENIENLYINGAWSKPLGKSRLTLVNATTEEVLGTVPEGSEADVDSAVAAAKAALPGWSRTPVAERAALMNKFADALEKRTARLLPTVSKQNGMPISLAEGLEGAYPIMMLRYYAQLAQSFNFEERRPSPLGFDTIVRREPVGVVAGIVPWNYPVVLSMTKIAPALATGCTIVLKPSPGTVLDSYIVAEAAHEAGIPKGVLNWVAGGRELGAYLVKHKDVQKVAFTGSTAAGRLIAAVCGQLLRPVSLELGGKSAAIILDDAKLDSVMTGLDFPSFANNGQTCTTCSRILAPKARYKEVVDALVAKASLMKVGDPLDKSTQVGPLASKEHRDRVEGYIAKGKTEARVALGGGRPKNMGGKGWFVEPTIFTDTDNNSTIAREEVFGPVLTVIPYDDEADAIRIANDSEYGLGGSVWSSDAEHALKVARQVETGTIGVNNYTVDMNAPFGGIKASGLGREFGPEALTGYVQYKSIYLPPKG